ncbi:hypothetical protein EGH10_08215 [Brevibacillus laterosporus]|nr:hypothetical protein DM460_14250 [Brevibacillus laterosporus]TPH14122.1 hypothetical protein EGH10_08215 [Brevibacillus laterosporus]
MGIDQEIRRNIEIFGENSRNICQNIGFSTLTMILIINIVILYQFYYVLRETGYIIVSLAFQKRE